jgi:hypothetical protein
MVEGFALEGSAIPYPIGDWRLQLNRVLEMVGAGRALLLQSYAVWEQQTRMFIVGSYLLVRGDRTYLNLDIDYFPEWWPEYDIPIGAPTESAAADIDDLWDGSHQVYRRSFDNGLVLVNPDPDSATTVSLDSGLYLVTASDGGSLPGDAVPTGHLEYDFVTQVVLEPASAAVLLDSEPDCAGLLPAPVDLDGDTTAQGRALSWSQGGADVPDHYNIYSSSGGCPDAGVVPVLVAEVGGSETSWLDSTDAPCSTLSYVVTASDAGDTCESAFSDCVSLADAGCQQRRPRRAAGRVGVRP